MRRLERKCKVVFYRLQSNISTDAGRELAFVCNDSGISKRAVIENAIDIVYMAANRGIAIEELREMVNALKVHALPSPEEIAGDAVKIQVGDSPTLNPSPTVSNNRV